MIHGGKKAGLLLFFGDLGVFTLSLLITLLIRYAGNVPLELFLVHLGPFAVLFLIWGLIFFLSGLYGKRIRLSQSSLTDAILKTQSFNIIIAALFFFFAPVGITPKTNLLIYLVVSLTCIVIWRIWLYPRFSYPRVRERALVLGNSDELRELVKEVNGNKRYQLYFEEVVDPSEYDEHSITELKRIVAEKRISVLIATPDEPKAEAIVSSLCAITREDSRIQFRTFTDVYEEVFDRIPLSELKPSWFLTYANRSDQTLYIVIKRLVDILGGLVMGVITVVLTPIIWVLQGFEGPGPLFISQERFGYKLAHVKALKFRSMAKNEPGAFLGETTNRVTKVGSILRKTSLDEFPQFWNVLKGEISLIGPRNDIVPLGERFREALPNYNFRYEVKPGITGWAQINQQYEQGNISPQSIEETKTRLAYDFYYLKHRSLGLDFLIALKTIKRMFFRVSNW